MKRVLLLEEDGEGRATLARILKKKGFNIIPAKDDAAAITVLASPMNIDLIIAGATERDRSEFLADVRTCRLDLPVIFLSDYCGPEARLRGLAFGPFSMSRTQNFYINVRPVAFHELDRLIRMVLSRHAGVSVHGLAAA
jgi:DNA-binding response OmpR family regulator